VFFATREACRITEDMKALALLPDLTANVWLCRVSVMWDFYRQNSYQEGGCLIVAISDTMVRSTTPKASTLRGAEAS